MTDIESLFLFFFIEVVKSNGKHIPQVVKAWVEQYEKDPKPAMVELLAMLFEVTILVTPFQSHMGSLI